MTARDRIRAEDLHAGYGEQEILRAITCSFVPGTFTGIIGPNGSGKTTLMRAFSRVIPSAGVLTLEGRDVRDYTPSELGMALGFVPQDEERPFSYTVMQVVLMSRYVRASRYASLSPGDYARCRGALEETGTAHLADRSIQTLSGGEWQRVLIARALAQDTPVLLLDEPTSHLDLAHQAEVLSLFRRLAGAGRTVIGVFHDLNLAALYCDRLIMVCDGRIVTDGTPAQVLTAQRIRQVYGADVVTSCHPATGRVFLLPVHAAARPPGAARLNVTVVSGGGSGASLFHFLAGRSFALSAGVLATTDTDYQTATALEIPCIPIPPFSHIPAAALEDLGSVLAGADRVILSAHPVGPGNLPVLLALGKVDPSRVVVHLPGGRDFGSYDFVRGTAAAAYRGLVDAGARCTATYEGVLAFLDGDAAGRGDAGRERDPDLSRSAGGPPPRTRNDGD